MFVVNSMAMTITGTMAENPLFDEKNPSHAISFKHTHKKYEVII